MPFCQGQDFACFPLTQQSSSVPYNISTAKRALTRSEDLPAVADSEIQLLG